MLERAWPSSTASPAPAHRDWWPRALPRASALLLLLLGLVSFPRRSNAEDTDRSRRILLTVAGPAADAEQLAAVVRELLQRLAMQVELRPAARVDLNELRSGAAAGSPYFARVWVSFEQTGKARLYLEHAARDRILVRDVLDEAHNPELVREELGHILQTAVEGLKAGEEIGAPRDEALEQVENEAAATATGKRASARPVAPAALSPPPPDSRARRLRFGPRYELVWLGDGRFTDGPGAVLVAVSSGRQRWGVELGGLFRRPLKVQESRVGARLQSMALYGLATFELRQGDGATFRVAAGVEAELVRVAPFAEPTRNVQLAENRWLKLVLGRVALTYAHPIGSFMDAELTLGAELDPGRTSFVFESSAGRVNVLSPWPLRPLVSLGATVP